MNTMSRTMRAGAVLALMALGAFAGAQPAAAAAFDSSQNLVAVTALNATDFSFFQDGFADAATVNGTFSGTDLDGDGQLSAFSGEISDFSMNFSGNTQVPAFSFGLSAFFALVYDLNGGPLGDGLTLDVEGIFATDGVFLYLAGPGPFEVCGVGIDCAIVGSLAVPEPAIGMLALVGLAGFARTRARRQHE